MTFSIDTYFFGEKNSNRVSCVLSNIVEQQIRYILFVLVLPSEMYSAGSSPTRIEYPAIPNKAASPSF